MKEELQKLETKPLNWFRIFMYTIILLVIVFILLEIGVGLVIHNGDAAAAFKELWNDTKALFR